MPRVDKPYTMRPSFQCDTDVFHCLRWRLDVHNRYQVNRVVAWARLSKALFQLLFAPMSGGATIISWDLAQFEEDRFVLAAELLQIAIGLFSVLF